MSITCQLKQISIPTLEILQQDPSILTSFFDTKWLPESSSWQHRKYWDNEFAEKVKQETSVRFTKSIQDRTLKQQLLSEWEIPELDLHKYFLELTYLLAGYIPGYISSEWTIPELRTAASQNQGNFLPFLVVDNSAWDTLPIVNAIGAGTEIGAERGYGKTRYLLNDEVGEILDGLLFLSEEGFQERYKRESEK